MPNFTDWQILVGLILLISFLTETIVETIKTQRFGNYIRADLLQILSILIAVILAFLLNASLFDTDALAIKLVGCLIVGLVASRGASYAHNWLDKLPRGKQ